MIAFAPILAAFALSASAPAALQAEPLAAPEAEAIHASGSGEALRVCCAVSACSFYAINDCSLLSPEGKTVAFVAAGAGGLFGFIAGAGLGLASYSTMLALAYPGETSLRVYETDGLLAFAILSGAAGVVLGTVAGGLLGVALDALAIPRPVRVFRASAPSRSPPSPAASSQSY